MSSTASSCSRLPTLPPAERQRFSRASRLLSRPQFDVAFKSGRKAVNRQLVAWIVDGPGPYPRLGLSVSRRVGNAPRRNRVKRCLRAAFRELAPGLPRPLDIVLIARPLAAPDTLLDARQALAHVLRVHERKHRPT